MQPQQGALEETEAARLSLLTPGHEMRPCRQNPQLDGEQVAAAPPYPYGDDVSQDALFIWSSLLTWAAHAPTYHPSGN